MVAWFNPNDPSTLGLEWFPTTEGSGSITSDTSGVLQQIEAQATDTIDRVRWRTNILTAGQPLVCEVFNAGSEVIGTVSEATYQPNEVVSSSNISDAAGSAVNMYQDIDDNPRSADLTDYLKGDAPSGVCLPVYPPTCWPLKLRFNSTGALSGKRILYIRLVIVAWGYVWLALDDGTTTVDMGNVLSEPAGYTTRTLTMYSDPTKSQLWTPTILSAMDTNYNWNFTIAEGTRIYALGLEVGYCNENRLAWAYETPTTTGEQTIEFDTLVNPAAGSSFARTNGNEYGYHLRRLPNGLSGPVVASQLTVPSLAPAPPIDDAKAYNPTMSATYGGAITALGTVQDIGYPVTLRKTTGPAITSDGQPYYGSTATTVYVANEVRQRFSPTVNTTYSILRALVAVDTQHTLADLSVGIYRVSDNVQFGSTASISRAAFAALPVYATIDGVDYKRVTFELPTSAALIGGTAYYAKFSSAATGATEDDGTNAWRLQYLTGLDGEAGLGGTTYYVTIHGANDTASDMPLVLISAPTAPASITVAIASQTVNAVGICGTKYWDYAHVTWTATALGTSFDHYEVQRSIDGGSTWELVCDNITTESDVSFDDYEGPRSTSTQYRVRTVRTDDAPSAWVTSGGYTPVSFGCVVGFVSNQQPSLNCVVLDESPREYNFLNAADVVHHKLAGRDYQVAFQPTEERGVEWPIPVTIYVDQGDGNDPEGGPGLGSFDALRAIAKADLPYVAVLDDDGNVLYSSLKVPSGMRREPGKYYTAKVIATQLTTTPDTEPA